MRFVSYRRVGLSVVVMAVLLAVAAVCVGCWDTGSFGAPSGKQEASQEVPYYYLELSVLDARTVTTVNGVGIDESDGRTSASFNSPTNALLIGKGNTVTVTVEPTMVAAGDPPKSGKLADADSVRPSTLEEAEVSVAIDKVTSGKVTPEGGKTIAEKTLKEVVEKREQALQEEFLEKLEKAPPEEKKALADREEELTSVELPIEMELTFDSEDVPSFRDRFVEAPVIEDTSALKDFAMRLKKAVEERDFDTQYKLFEPKYVVYNEAYPSRAKEDRRSWFENVQSKYFYPNGPLLDFEREDLELRKWADGRIWEVNVDRGEGVTDQFLLTRSTDKGRAFMDIFVGKVDGELKVVR